MSTAGSPGPDPDRAALRAVLAQLEHRTGEVIAEVRARRSGEVDDRFRGLYVSPAHADEVIATRTPDPPRPAPIVPDASASRLSRMAERAGLDALDLTLLIVALAPDLDRRFEPLYGYLNDEVSQRRATVGLALTLAGLPSDDPGGRARLSPTSRLVRNGLLDLDADERPMLSRELHVPDRVTAFLLGDDTPDPALSRGLVGHGRLDGPVTAQLAEALRLGAPLAYLREHRGAHGGATAVSAAGQAGRPAVALNLARADDDEGLDALIVAAVREAALRGGIVVAGPLEALRRPDTGSWAALVRRCTDRPAPTVLFGSSAWDPSWSTLVPLVLDADRAGPGERIAAAREVLAPAEVDQDVLVQALGPLQLGPEATQRAAETALMHARLEHRQVSTDDLRRGARAQSPVALERLARRIAPQARIEQLVLPPAVEEQVLGIVTRWRYRETVHEQWGLRTGSRSGGGVSALFAGPSGTGKTLSGEVIAAEIGVELYLVDLSQVIDKYIGETSKNLDRIFDAADRVDGVLLFDEADALFGKRSSVSDSKDRYANVEVAYLLQRMEAFDGIAILTTNLAGNLDEAFLRRLDVIADFVAPDAALRRRLWEAKLPASLPRADDLDLDVLADRFELTGSEIASIVTAAAFEAASSGGPVTMSRLVHATIAEHRKLQRAISPSQLRELERDGHLG